MSIEHLDWLFNAIVFDGLDLPLQQMYMRQLSDLESSAKEGGGDNSYIGKDVSHSLSCVCGLTGRDLYVVHKKCQLLHLTIGICAVSSFSGVWLSPCILPPQGCWRWFVYWSLAVHACRTTGVVHMFLN